MEINTIVSGNPTSTGLFHLMQMAINEKPFCAWYSIYRFKNGRLYYFNYIEDGISYWGESKITINEVGEDSFGFAKMFSLTALERELLDTLALTGVYKIERLSHGDTILHYNDDTEKGVCWPADRLPFLRPDEIAYIGDLLHFDAICKSVEMGLDRVC